MVRSVASSSVCPRLLQVTPLYNSALVAVQSLNKKDMSELKSYGSPPDTVRLVAKAICALLGVEET